MDNLQGVPDPSGLDTTKSSTEKLVPTGRIFHVYRADSGNYVMEESDHDFFTEIIIAKDMVNDHFPINYEARWKRLVNDSMTDVMMGNRGKSEIDL